MGSRYCSTALHASWIPPGTISSKFLTKLLANALFFPSQLFAVLLTARRAVQSWRIMTAQRLQHYRTASRRYGKRWFRRWLAYSTCRVKAKALARERRRRYAICFACVRLFAKASFTAPCSLASTCVSTWRSRLHRALYCKSAVARFLEKSSSAFTRCIFLEWTARARRQRHVRHELLLFALSHQWRAMRAAWVRWRWYTVYRLALFCLFSS